MEFADVKQQRRLVYVKLTEIGNIVYRSRCGGHVFKSVGGLYRTFLMAKINPISILDAAGIPF